ncbi:hypothetical protein G7054_g14187 [Neopestalotiopsis clavispora]|nr:hypothetical protein G7054_g14187 [Neopestalotiopsis clavispora]
MRNTTFDKTNPSLQYIDFLENRLQRAQALLKKSMPDFDLQDYILSPAFELEFRLREQVRVKAVKKREPLLPGILDVCQFKIDNKIDDEFHGPSSEFVSLENMKGYLEAQLSCGYQLPLFVSIPEPSGLSLVHRPLSAAGHPASKKGSLSGVAVLPLKVVARRLCSYSVKYATSILRVVHVPSFYNMLDKIYDRGAGDYGSYGTDEDKKLALLYSLALGSTHSTESGEISNPRPNEVAIERECYDLIGIALRSAVRLGCIEIFHTVGKRTIDVESRRRVFSVCRQMDIYVSALLGLPILLNEDDIDQPLPTPVDDEFITKAGIIPMAPDTTSFFGAFKAHAQLLDMLKKVTKHIYPAQGTEGKRVVGEQLNVPCVISYDRVEELEAVLQEWLEALPVAWEPNSEGPADVVHIQNLLRFAFAYGEILSILIVYESTDLETAVLSFTQSYEQIKTNGELPAALSLQPMIAELPGQEKSFALLVVWGTHDHDEGRRWFDKIAHLGRCVSNSPKTTSLYGFLRDNENATATWPSHGRACTTSVKSWTTQTARVIAKYGKLMPGDWAALSVHALRSPTPSEVSVLARG